MMVFGDLIRPEDLHSIDEDLRANLSRLHFCLNTLRIRYGKPLTVSSGYRSVAAQTALYEKLGRPPKLQSWHLFGGAADLADPNHELQHWLLENLQFLEDLDLYCEAFDATPGWVHLQIYPPASNRRFFEP